MARIKHGAEDMHDNLANTIDDSQRLKKLKFLPFEAAVRRQELAILRQARKLAAIEQEIIYVNQELFNVDQGLAILHQTRKIANIEQELAYINQELVNIDQALAEAKMIRAIVLDTMSGLSFIVLVLSVSNDAPIIKRLLGVVCLVAVYCLACRHLDDNRAYALTMALTPVVFSFLFTMT